jgi:hypothetical protein
MKKILLILLVVILPLNLFSQRDSSNLAISSNQKDFVHEAYNVNIYPVPVRDNTFTIKADKEISFVKITNIIGQDIFRIKYNTPLTISKIVLDNPRRGMYLVVILFNDNTRVVKKVMIEGTD